MYKQKKEDGCCIGLIKIMCLEIMFRCLAYQTATLALSVRRGRQTGIEN